MYYFYSVLHKKSGVSALGISKHDPRVIKGFRGSNSKLWRQHLKKYSRYRGVAVKVLHSSNDLNDIIRWRKYYYKHWDVLNNPKFVHSRYKRVRPSISGDKSHFAHKSHVTEKRLKWYTNGYDNLFITEGTQPPNYRRGRKIHRGLPALQPSLKSRQRNAKAHMKPVISPEGKRYKSVQDAAKDVGIAKCTMQTWLKKGLWKYA